MADTILGSFYVARSGRGITFLGVTYFVNTADKSDTSTHRVMPVCNRVVTVHDTL
jgi:hypothetical protein